MGIVNNLKNFVKEEWAFKTANPFIYGNNGNQSTWLYNNKDANYFKIDGELEKIEPQLNSAVAICSDIGLNLFRNASLKLYKPEGDGRVRVKRDPMASLIFRPNTLYSAKLMWAAIYLDYWMEGNAYLMIDRTDRVTGKPKLTPQSLFYLPSCKVSAVSKTTFIDYYEYVDPDGVKKKIPKADIIHFRKNVNKNNMRYGWAPLKSTLLQVMSDQEAARFLAALLKNNAVPGVVLVPGTGVTVDRAEASIFKRMFKAAFTGAGRGGVMVAGANMEVKVLGQSPKDMAIGDMNDSNEQRIAGAWGLPIEITPFNAGSKKSTFNNKGEAHLMAYTSNVIPTCNDFEDTLNDVLCPAFGYPDGDYFYAYDTSGIAVLQENLAEKEDRMINLVQGGIIAVNEARKELKYPATPRPEDNLPVPIAGSTLAEDPNNPQIQGQDPSQLPTKKALELTEGYVDGEVIEPEIKKKVSA